MLVSVVSRALMSWSDWTGCRLSDICGQWSALMLLYAVDVIRKERVMLHLDLFVSVWFLISINLSSR